MNFLIRHVKLAGDSAKDFHSTSSSIIHIARCLVSVANAGFCRDVTRFAACALVAFFPIAHFGGCTKERPFIVSFLTSLDEERALLFGRTCCVIWVMWSVRLSFSEKLPSSDGNKGWFIEISIQNDS